MGLLALLVVALLGGSAYILLRPDEALAARNGAAGDGRGQSGEGTAIGQQGYGFQRGARDQGQAGAGRGRNGSTGGERVSQQRQGGGEVLGEGAADHPAETWLTLSGWVVDLTGDELTVQTEEGSVAVHLGPEWYWESEGITLHNEDRVAVTGFYEGDAFEVVEIENLSTQETVSLRDGTGRPLWTGRGRGGRASAVGS
jgi:hypothetical protein